MAQGTSTQVTVDEAKPDLKTQLAEYVAGQPVSTQVMHNWMNWLTIASMAVPVGLFARALYFSINWKRVDPIQIPIAWFLFVAGGTVFMFITGLHAVLLRAFPPIPELSSRFVTGKNAVWRGAGMMVVALLIAAFWGFFFAYVVWTRNMAMVEVMVKILANVVGVGAVIAVLSSLYQKFRRKL
jgi:hypothetical protein